MTPSTKSLSVLLGAGLVVAGCVASTSSGGDGGGASGDASADGPASSSGSSGSGSSSSGASSSSSGGGSSSSGGQALKWYWTCGDPVCMAPTGDAGPLTNDAGVPCPAAGSSCSVAGQSCGTSSPGVNCGATEVCAGQDPTMSRGGCPLSSRRFKDGIEYVDGEGLRALHDETVGLRLATYNYKGQYADPDPRHLGFIIEDTPPRSPAVSWSRDRVDMYGYLSMVVATMQVQEKEIEELRRELAESRAGVCR